MLTEIAHQAIDQVVGGVDWLKHLVFGEFDEARPLSVLVTTMMLAFVPGVAIVISARDLTAILIRLAKHPEKRDETDEWILLIACSIPLVLPILAAAVGAAAAGVGAAVGGIVGTEVGGLLRGVCLALIRESKPILANVVGFLRKYVKGDILKALQAIKFVEYQKALVQFITGFIDQLIGVIGRVRAELLKVPKFRALNDVLKQMAALERAFYEVQKAALLAIPKALAELDRRLQQVISQLLPQKAKSVITGVQAPIPTLMIEGPRPPPSQLGQVHEGGGASPASAGLSHSGSPPEHVPGNKPGDVGSTSEPAKPLDPKPALAKPSAPEPGVAETASSRQVRVEPAQNLHPEKTPPVPASARELTPSLAGRTVRIEPVERSVGEDLAEKFGGVRTDYVWTVTRWTVMKDGEAQVVQSDWILNITNGRKFNFNYITDEANVTGLVSQISSHGVVNLSLDTQGSPIHGREMFDKMMEAYGDNVTSIRGYWVSRVEGAMNKNLGVVNLLTANGMPLDEAIHHAWTAQSAARFGYTVPELGPVHGTPGNYTKIDVLWSKD